MSHTDPVVPAVDGRPGRILVADDEEKNRRILRDILEAQGHQVTLAEDGQQALEKALADPPDVVLLDVMMPKMDGYEVCRQLRKDSRTAPLSILMVTALKDRDDRLKGIRAGANDFLTKPIDAEEIRLRVKNAVLVQHLYGQVQADYARLKELESLRDNLTHMIVHDLRSPLMAVSLSLGIVMREPAGLTPAQKQFVAVAQGSCRELIEMVSSVLDVSRMEAGQMPLNRVSCDIRQIAGSAAELVDVLAREKALTLGVTGDPAGADVDREVIRRVLANLMGNAIKFAPDGSAIGVHISAANGTVRATVTDQGRGIPSEFHGRIFEKFGQVESREQGQKRSTGLGLTFCKLAVEAHGGQIGVESPSAARVRPGSPEVREGEEGTGSCFWFTLPGTVIGEGQG